MDFASSPSSTSGIKCCDCDCSCSVMSRSLSGTYLRSVKRKFQEEDEFRIPGIIIPQNARVEIENECTALREMVGSQQTAIQDLISELEEERNASSSAANEAMSMILRLQREKAEVQMDARQFKRYAEEKMAHDQHETLVLEDLLYKREQAIQSLTCEVHAYKHRMISYGLTEAEADGEKGVSRNGSLTENVGQLDFPRYDIYPPLKCSSFVYGNNEEADVEKYAAGETPRDQLNDLEHRINELEKSPRHIQPDGEYSGANNGFEKVIVGESPRRPKHLRKFSTDSSKSRFTTGKEIGQDVYTDSPHSIDSFKNKNFASNEENPNLGKVDDASEIGDDMSDRVYTIDSIHQEASLNGFMGPKASIALGDDYTVTPVESPNNSHIREIEIQKLYARLHALEADRESMRKSIISMGTDKAQLVLLKEIAQNLCKEMSPGKNMPSRKHSISGSFTFVSIFKWVTSFVFWRKKSVKSRYMFGLSSNNAGLLLLLDQRPRGLHWKRISCVHISNRMAHPNSDQKIHQF